MADLSGLGLVCVLDDFHAIQDPAILPFCERLLAHRPSGCTWRW
jgi:ATP/maltotriose-dependent transcriptional regulator MalT